MRPVCIAAVLAVSLFGCAAVPISVPVARNLSWPRHLAAHPAKPSVAPAQPSPVEDVGLAAARAHDGALLWSAGPDVPADQIRRATVLMMRLQTAVRVAAKDNTPANRAAARAATEALRDYTRTAPETGP